MLSLRTPTPTYRALFISNLIATWLSNRSSPLQGMKHLMCDNQLGGPKLYCCILGHQAHLGLSLIWKQLTKYNTRNKRKSETIQGRHKNQLEQKQPCYVVSSCRGKPTFGEIAPVSQLFGTRIFLAKGMPTQTEYMQLTCQYKSYQHLPIIAVLQINGHYFQQKNKDSS